MNYCDKTNWKIKLGVVEGKGKSTRNRSLYSSRITRSLKTAQEEEGKDPDRESDRHTEDDENEDKRTKKQD